MAAEDAGAEGSSNKLDINATSVFYTKQTPPPGAMAAPSPEAPGISIKYSVGGAWQKKNLPLGKTFIKIGSGSECDVVIPGVSSLAKIHLVARLIFDNWYVLEYAPERSMFINGVKRPQAILREGEACVVFAGGVHFAIQSVSKAKAPPPVFDPMKPILSFKTKDREFKFNLDPAALIGSADECKLPVPELPAVAGSLFAHLGRPFIFSTVASLGIDGSDALAPRELKDGMTVTVDGKTYFAVSIKPKPEDVPGFRPPSEFKGSLVLVDLTGSRLGSKLIMPPAGRSLLIGRSQSNHFIIESPNISKKHAQLIIYDNSVLVLDAHSTNGTYVEEEQVAKRLLHPGEIVRFADRSFLLCHSE